MLKNEHLRQVLDSVDVTYVARDNREALEQKIISHWSRTGGSGAASARGEQEGARPEGGEQGGSCDGMDVEEEDKSDTAASPSSVGGSREGEQADSTEGRQRAAAAPDAETRAPGAGSSAGGGVFRDRHLGEVLCAAFATKKAMTEVLPFLKDKDKLAFRAVKASITTEGQQQQLSKEQIAQAIAECRPGEVRDAGGLLSWLIKVRNVQGPVRGVWREGDVSACVKCMARSRACVKRGRR